MNVNLGPIGHVINVNYVLFVVNYYIFNIIIINHYVICSIMMINYYFYSYEIFVII